MEQYQQNLFNLNFPVFKKLSYNIWNHAKTLASACQSNQNTLTIFSNANLPFFTRERSSG